MYVPGTLNDVEHVLVDVGTGYYVEKVGRKVIDNKLLIPFIVQLTHKFTLGK